MGNIHKKESKKWMRATVKNIQKLALANKSATEKIERSKNENAESEFKLAKMKNQPAF